MKNKHIKWYIIAGCIALFLALTSYHKGPWRGRVIDAETKKPIEGAAVVAVWQWGYEGPAGDTQSFLNARETLTDKDGNFDMPSASFIKIPAVRKIYGPYFTIFKPGYGYFPDHQVSPTHNISEEIFRLENSVVELPKLKTAKERIDTLPSTPVMAPFRKVPKLLSLINSEAIKLGLEPIGPKED